jgi:hypothetical protein
LLDDKFDPKRAFDNESFPVEEEERIETMVSHRQFFILSPGDNMVESSIKTRKDTLLPGYHALAS